MVLTEEQKKRIADNRAKALERLKNRGTQRNQTSLTSAVASTSTNHSNNSVPERNSNTNSQQSKQNSKRSHSYISKDYIEYDLSKMVDSRGGFIPEDDIINDKNKQTLKEWQEQQQKDSEIPSSISKSNKNNPSCFECNTIEIDYLLYRKFNKARVCKQCEKKYPEKYSLLTKTECRQDYLLTDPELNDQDLLPHLEKPNPHKQTYSNMMLYLRYQVEEYSFKKWNGGEGLDAEYERRVQQTKERKDKKFLKKLQDMRKKTRAEEYTRRIKDGRGIRDHTHEWGDAVQVGDDERVVARRCFGCGLETEELLI